MSRDSFKQFWNDEPKIDEKVVIGRDAFKIVEISDSHVFFQKTNF